MKIKDYSPQGAVKKRSLRKHLITAALILYWPVYRLLLPFVRNRKKTFKYGVSLCLIFKNEAPYLKEWIEYHRLIGVEHFYLYNNFSDDNFNDILQPYIDEGIVTYTDFPFKYAQLKAYSDCYEKACNETEWLGFIDADEYINLQNSNSIREFLHRYRKYPSVYFNWRIFGTSGHLKENYSELTTERYTQAWDHLCSTGKTFINNAFKSFSIKSAHFMHTRLGNIPLPSVTVNEVLAYNLNCSFSSNIHQIAYINHYWSRSYQFYVYKNFHKDDVASSNTQQIKTQTGRFQAHELNNNSKDFSIQRWLTQLKLQLHK